MFNLPDVLNILSRYSKLMVLLSIPIVLNKSKMLLMIDLYDMANIIVKLINTNDIIHFLGVFFENINIIKINIKRERKAPLDPKTKTLKKEVKPSIKSVFLFITIPLYNRNAAIKVIAFE